MPCLWYAAAVKQSGPPVTYVRHIGGVVGCANRGRSKGPVLACNVRNVETGGIRSARDRDANVQTFFLFYVRTSPRKWSLTNQKEYFFIRKLLLDWL